MRAITHFIIEILRNVCGLSSTKCHCKPELTSRSYPFPRTTPASRNSCVKFFRCKPFCVAPRVKSWCGSTVQRRVATALRLFTNNDGTATPLSRMVLRRAPLAPSVQSAQNDTRILVLGWPAARRPRMMTPF